MSMQNISQEYRRLLLTRQSARTRRCHTLNVLHDQNISEHTFNALCILDFVAPTASKDTWQALLYHDVPEAITGDVPAVAKWKYPALEEALKIAENKIQEEYDLLFPLSEEERKLVKFADMLELAFYGIEEVKMGNRDFGKVVLKILLAIEYRHLRKLNERTEWLFDMAKLKFESTGGLTHAYDE